VREPDLGIANPEDILEIAASEVRAAAALRDDLLHALFPYGHMPPSELLQTRVKLKLQALVAGIQRAMGVEDTGGKSWDMLARSGLMRECALIDFALSRLAEEKLQGQLASSDQALPLAQLPAALLGHENPLIAEMAMKLLQAEQVALDEHSLFRRLAPEQFHLLCWRVVAALQSEAGDDCEALPSIVQDMLSAHRGEDDPATVARKLAFFLGADWQPELADPRRAGLHLFMAMLSQTLMLPTDQLIRLIAEGGVEPAMVMLKAAGISADQAVAGLVALRGDDCGWSTEQMVSTYEGLDLVEVRAQIATWTQQTGMPA
jgi:hypothetical protein